MEIEGSRGDGSLTSRLPQEISPSETSQKSRCKKNRRRMPSLIWNPFFGHYIPMHQTKVPLLQSHEIVLDLSTDKASQDKPADLVKKESFDFKKFYKTYEEIASREPPVSRNRKRRLSSGSSDSDQSIIQETKKSRTEETVYDNGSSFTSNHLRKEQSSRQQEQQEDLSKSVRVKKEQKIASIRDSCDCRFCYEDHIIKMRLKRSKPWLNV